MPFDRIDQAACSSVTITQRSKSLSLSPFPRYASSQLSKLVTNQGWDEIDNILKGEKIKLARNESTKKAAMNVMETNVAR